MHEFDDQLKHWQKAMNYIKTMDVYKNVWSHDSNMLPRVWVICSNFHTFYSWQIYISLILDRNDFDRQLRPITAGKHLAPFSRNEEAISDMKGIDICYVWVVSNLGQELQNIHLYMCTQVHIASPIILFLAKKSVFLTIYNLQSLKQHEYPIFT